jgi:hypothetical protein
MNDRAADIGRRDRMASLLLSVEVRTGQVPVLGKKARADAAALTAGIGTGWEGLLNPQPEGTTPPKGGRWADVLPDRQDWGSDLDQTDPVSRN